MNEGAQGQGVMGGQDDEPPLVDDGDADGADVADDGDPTDPSPKTDVSADDDTDAPDPE